MDSHDRIVAAFGHRPTDRTPWIGYSLQPRVYGRLLGRTPLDIGACVAEHGFEYAMREYAREQVDLAVKWGFDLLLSSPIDPSGYRPRPAPPPEATLPADPVDRVRLSNERRRRALERLDQTGYEEGAFLIYRLLQEEMDRREVRIPFFLGLYRHGVWENIDLIETMAAEPEVAREHFRIGTLENLRYIERVKDFGTSVYGVGGSITGNRPLISREAYRRLIFPEICQLAGAIREAGMYSVNGSSGATWYMIDEFLLDNGVDGYFEVDSRASMDLVKLKELCGDRKTFFGNIDPGDFLSFSTVEQIRRRTFQCIEEGGGTGHVFCTSNAILASVPEENYMAMFWAFREYFGMKRVN